MSDQGERSSVTAGKNMDGFAALVTRLVESNGLKRRHNYAWSAAFDFARIFSPYQAVGSIGP